MIPKIPQAILSEKKIAVSHNVQSNQGAYSSGENDSLVYDYYLVIDTRGKWDSFLNQCFWGHRALKNILISGLHNLELKVEGKNHHNATEFPPPLVFFWKMFIFWKLHFSWTIIFTETSSLTLIISILLVWGLWELTLSAKGWSIVAKLLACAFWRLLT